MADQAQALRTLMEQRRSTSYLQIAGDKSPLAKVLGVTSAKGGVGKTTLAIQTARAFVKAGYKVCVWDVNGNASHDLLSGFQHSWTLSHLLTGARSAEEVMTPGPDGIQFLLGNGVSNLTTALSGQSQVLQSAINSWQRKFNVLILDLPGTVGGEVQSLISSCDSSWLVCTSEPTAVAATYTFIKQSPNLLSRTSIMVNQVDSSEEAFDVIDRLQQTTKLFLQSSISAAGFVPQDRSLNQSEQWRFSESVQSTVDGLASRWLLNFDVSNEESSFVDRFGRLATADWEETRAA